jgi:hypothetical protein
MSLRVSIAPRLFVEAERRKNRPPDRSATQNSNQTPLLRPTVISSLSSESHPITIRMVKQDTGFIVSDPFCEILNALKIRGGTLIVGRPFPMRLKKLRRSSLFYVSPHFPVHVR